MRPEARALGQALLEHHRAKTAASPPGGRLIVSRYTVAYGELCARAGVPYLTQIVGSFLGEIAEWCSNNGYPPLNSLAVNGSTGQPGDGYDGAGGFKMINWRAEVELCIRYTGYPQKMP